MKAGFLCYISLWKLEENLNPITLQIYPGQCYNNIKMPGWGYMKKRIHLLDGISKFSVKMFLLIIGCVVIPLSCVCIYIRGSMETFIQKKLSESVIQNIARGERNICDALQDLVSISNVFVFDEELKARIADKNTTAYENTIYFNNMVENMYIKGGDEPMQQAKIILFDNYDRIYSNWSLNYQDYRFLLQQDWVKRSRSEGGHVVWSMFSPAYIIEDQMEETYISLAKSILKDGTAGERIGTMIISIGQRQFSELLMEYAYAGDVAYVCLEDGTVLLENDVDRLIGKEELQEIYEHGIGEKSGSLQQTVSGQEYLISYYTIPRPWVFDDQQMKVFHFTDYEEVSNQVKKISDQMNLVLVVVLFCLAGILYLSIRWLVKPIVALSEQMKQYTPDTEITGIDVNRKDEIGYLNQAFCQMSENIKRLFARLAEENEIKEKYRYESLRAQLNPHFLFNTLTTIRWMAIIRGADNIVDSIDALAHMLKYSMSRENGLVTVREEVENIKNYIYIQNCRYGNHCTLDIDLAEEILPLKTMKFILQPIVENAVIHGYHKNQEQIIIKIYGQLEEERLRIWIEDDGVGISQQVISQFESSKQTRSKESKLTGIGLTNVDECIRITFGSQYGVTIGGQEKKGTIVTFTLPVIEKGEQSDEEDHDCR